MFWLIKSFLVKLFDSAMALNKGNILKSVPVTSTESLLLDLGCDDGEWALQMASKSGISRIYGVEIVPHRAEQARTRGLQVEIANLEERIPFPDQMFDVVHANQVIEHLGDIDHFAQEISRVLKPGGVAIISTENASSWHNVFAAAMGWQIFSLTNLSGMVGGVGNPLALHRGESVELKSWTHKTIFSHRGLKEFFQVHGFKNVKIRGAGYYPLPSFFGTIDPRHAAFITLVAEKN